jgi:hypothetical protein
VTQDGEVGKVVETEAVMKPTETKLFDDSNIEAEWSEENMQRLDEVESGKVKLVSWEEVEKSFKRIRAEAVRAKDLSTRSE